MMSREWRSLDAEMREKIRAHQDEAPVKLGAIAKQLGIKVMSSTLQAGISGEIRPDGASPAGYAIRVNRHDASTRQRFTVAHEVGHFLLHRDHIGDGITDDVLYRSALTDWREAEANRLASDILMPDHLVRHHLEDARAKGVLDVSRYLAEIFEVSEAAMNIRLEMF